MKISFNLLLSALLLTGMAGVASRLTDHRDLPVTGHGDPQTLHEMYRQWKSAYEARGHNDVLRISLGHSRVQSRDLSNARGSAALNLSNGEFKVVISGLPTPNDYDVWLLDNHHKTTSGNAIRIGMLNGDGEQKRLITHLDPEQLQTFTLDTIAIAKAGETPASGGLLFGSPGLMQRLYYNERFWPVANIGSASDNPHKSASAPRLQALLPKPAFAATTAPGTTDQLSALIAKGRDIFLTETFNGNGRTCSTCHRPDNNHTIDPSYIAKLPATDPLFVAEYDKKLSELEKPALLRQFGLFVANLDGFDRPPVMRSPSHLLGLSQSLKFETKAMGGEFIEDDVYFDEHNALAKQDGRETQAIGWSGDGAPEGGSLRDFAKGAIKQHLPKSMARIENVDFRLPTEDELDALEAYLLSLGRSQELNLAAMTFKSPAVQKGKLLFDTKQNPVNNGATVFGSTANCNGCHMNAGAISSTTGGNPTRDTGVERMKDQLHHLVDPEIAYDGGFGQQQQHDCGPGFDQVCYNDGSADPRNIRPAAHSGLNRFNTPSLAEAADTAPFFHNNSVSTLEETVAYYNTDAFNQSPGAFTSKGLNRQVKLDSSQVIAVALFLRSINVLENIRSANKLDEKALALRGKASSDMVKLAIADTEDAIQVLTEAVINPYPQALEKLKAAYDLEKSAANAFSLGRPNKLHKAIALRNEAKNLMVDGE